MKTKLLKYGFWSLIFSVASQFTMAQSIARTAYFMDNATHRHLMNPALAPTNGYFSLPIAGELSLGVESNMQFTNFIYPGANGGELLTFLHPDVDATDFLSRLEPVNFMRMDMRTSILSLGFYSGTGFWTFDVASRVNMNLNLPYDLFAFLKKGMSNSSGNLYEIRDLSVGAGMFGEVSLGYSRNILNNLRVGAKVKFLAGGANMKANIEKMDINMRPDQWTITTQGQMDVYGKGLAYEKDTAGTINGVSFGSPGLGGMGAAFDLGLTYSPIKNLDLSIGVIDIGGIKWKKANSLKAGASGSVTFSGLDGIGSDSTSTNYKSTEDQITEIKDDLLKMADLKEQTVTEDYFQKLFPTINAGIEYSMLRNKVSLGLLYTTRLMENERYSELMGALNLKPCRWFNLSGSYSYMHGKEETFGFAMGFMPGIINIFMACDYTFLKVSPQYIPLNTLTSNFQLGVSIPLGRGHLPNKH